MTHAHRAHGPAVKGPCAEVQSGTFRVHGSARRRAAAGNRQHHFCLQAWKNLREQLGLGKSCSLGKGALRTGMLTSSAQLAPHKEREHKHASLAFLLPLQVPPRADPPGSEREGKRRSSSLQRLASRAQSRTENGPRSRPRVSSLLCGPE